MSLTSFLKNFKNSRDRTTLLDGKEAELYNNFPDINYLNIQQLGRCAMDNNNNDADKEDSVNQWMRQNPLF